jgi:integration host factor subunit beta
VGTNRSDLIERLCEKSQKGKAWAELVFDTVFGCMRESMLRGDKVELRGFGTFQIRSYRGYQGWNPQTGKTVAVKQKRLPHFKVSATLAARVNEGRGNTLGCVSPDPSGTSKRKRGG